MVIPYRRAWQIRQEEQNRLAWLQGLYIYEALCDVSPVMHAFAKSGTRVHPYSEKPYQFESEKKKRRKERNEQKKQNAVAFMEKLSATFNAQFERKRKAEKERLEAGVAGQAATSQQAAEQTENEWTRPKEEQ